MKRIALILAFILSASAFAQENTLATRVSKPVSNSQIGIYVGLDYMNLTDVHMSGTRKIGTNEVSEDSVGGTHIGLGGVNLGYSRIPEQGLGFSAGARLVEALNPREFGDEKLRIVIPEANIAIAFHKMVTVYIGLNTSVWSGWSNSDKFKAEVGGQTGLGLRLTKNIALNAGYTMLNQKYSSSDKDDTAELNLQVSGFNSNVLYTF